jgi:hypothetical protein
MAGVSAITPDIAPTLYTAPDSDVSPFSVLLWVFVTA